MKANELKQIIMEELQKALKEELTAKQKKLAALAPPKDKVTQADVIQARKGKHYEEEEEGSLNEKELTPGETKKKEKFVKSMKGMAKDFEKRYPGRGEEVMYATATKMAERPKKKG